MTRRLPLFAAALGGIALLTPVASSDDPKKPPAKVASTEVDLVEQVLASRKQYQQSLANLYEYYAKQGGTPLEIKGRQSRRCEGRRCTAAV